jgi:opacity protein-like surface antigen
MRPVIALLVPFLLYVAPESAAAQILPDLPLSVEARVGVAIPVGDFADAQPGIEAEAGPAFAVGAAYHFTPMFALFGEYEWAAFSCPRCDDAGIDDEVIDSGAGFGLEASLPLAGLGPWLRAGGVYHEIEFSGEGGQLSSEPALGFQIGAGASVMLLPALRITPGIFYRTYSAELDLGGLPSETVDVNHLTVDVGLSYRF